MYALILIPIVAAIVFAYKYFNLKKNPVIKIVEKEVKVHVKEEPKWDHIIIDKPRGRQDKEYKAIVVEGVRYAFTNEALTTANERSVKFKI